MSKAIESIIRAMKLDEEATDDFFASIVSDYAYQGLDIDAILKKIDEKLNSDPSKAKNLLILVAIGLYRGNKVDKISKTMSDAKGKQLKQMVSFFGIKESIGQDKRTTLTLSRLAIVLPTVAARCLSYEALTRPATNAHLLQEFKVIGFNIDDPFPAVLRGTFIASLIPNKTFNSITSEHLNSALVCITGYAYVESMILQQKKSNRKSGLQLYEEVITYVRTAWNSPHTTTDQRESFFSTNDLKDINGGLWYSAIASHYEMLAGGKLTYI